MSLTIHESDPLTQDDADKIIAAYPDHEVVYLFGSTIVWTTAPHGPHTVVLAGVPNPFQLDGHLDTIGVPKPRIVLNMKDEDR